MQILICQCFMLTVLWCFAGWSSWFHLKFYPSIVHEKCNCTNSIEITSVFQSCFLSGFTVLKVLYPSGLALWIWGSLSLRELFVSLYSKWEKNYPTILRQNPWRISIIWTENVPELCHCSGRAWRSFAPFPRPLLCSSNAASEGHM